MNTYFIRTRYFSDEIKKLMKKNKWIEEGKDIDIFTPKSKKFLPVDLFFVDSKYMFSNLSYHTNKSKIINVLSGNLVINILTDKFNYNINMINMFPNMKKHIPISLSFNIYNIGNLIYFLNNKNLYIVKPQFGYGGQGIKIVSNYNEVFNHIKDKDENWIIQKYIKQPLLYKGYKFHFRTYLMIRKMNNKINGFLYDKFWMYRAKKKYNLKNLDDEDIHITNVSKGGKMIPGIKLKDEIGVKRFNKIKKDIEKISKKSIEMIKKMRLCREKFEDEPHICYEVLGVDYMVDEKDNVILLEFNTQVGYKKKPNKWKREFLNSQFSETVCKLFKNYKTDYNYFTKII